MTTMAGCTNAGDTSVARIRAMFNITARPRRVLRGAAVVSAAIFFAVLSPALSVASPAGVLIGGGSWLKGQGVDVYGNGGDTWNTYYQCVELPQMRLYPKFGWPKVYAAGNGGAAYIPEGSPGLQRYNPGSGYLPVPGDLIVEHPTGTNSYGHVAVVDRIDGNTIWAVEQNASNNGWHAYSYNGSSYAGGYGAVKAVMHAPQNTFTNAVVVNNGDFVQLQGTPEIYRVAGGAPIYVSNWANVGGPQPVKVLNAQQFNQLRSVPQDGTQIVGQPRGEVYTVAGGAPIYLSNFANVPGSASQPRVTVDAYAIDQAGGAGALSHLRAVPSDGTFIESATRSEAYVVVGGAPLYISDWSRVGGWQGKSVTKVDIVSIDNAGPSPARWSHLRQVPADGTYVGGSPRGEVYMFAGGAPLYVSSWANVGGAAGKNVTGVDAAALDNAGTVGARWSHARSVPSDGTLITGYARKENYVFAGGAPIHTPTLAAIGRSGSGLPVDEAVLSNAGGAGAWKHVNKTPVDGTRLKAFTSKKTYVTRGGVPVEEPAPAGTTPVTIADAAIANAGGTGPWAFLAKSAVGSSTGSSGAADPIAAPVATESVPAGGTPSAGQSAGASRIKVASRSRRSILKSGLRGSVADGAVQKCSITVTHKGRTLASRSVKSRNGTVGFRIRFKGSMRKLVGRRATLSLTVRAKCGTSRLATTIRLVDPSKP